MAASGYRTIMIRGGTDNSFNREEKLAGEANIKPGHLLAISSGAAIKHATADGVQQALVAIENAAAESATASNIDIAYTNGDTLHYAVGKPGDVLYMWLATANDAVEGVSQLVSNGDGTLKLATVAAGTLTGAVVGVPAESLNNTSGSAARLAVRLL